MLIPVAYGGQLRTRKPYAVVHPSRATSYDYPTPAKLAEARALWWAYDPDATWIANCTDKAALIAHVAKKGYRRIQVAAS